jgi:hypothetical protein
MPRKGFKVGTTPVQETTVRITRETRTMLSKLQKGEEPIGDVIKSALIELQELQKKVKALEQELWEKVAVESPTIDIVRARYKV